MSIRRESTRRERSRGRKTEGSFVRLAHHLLQSRTFRELSPAATKVFVVLLAQYNGYNNGSLALPRSELPKYRFGKSGATVGKALKELQRKGLIFVTKPGGYESGATLYAVTSEPLDHGSQHELAATRVASHEWKKHELELERDSKKTAERKPFKA